MSESDRRTQARVPVEMWVEEASDNAVYFQRSANVSIGGLFLENSVPHPAGTRVTLRFTLPGDEADIRTAAVIVRTEIGPVLGMHLQFVDLPEEAAARIDKFVARALQP